MAKKILGVTLTSTEGYIAEANDVKDVNSTITELKDKNLSEINALLYEKGLTDDQKRKLNAITGSIYLFQGSVDTYNDLPTSDINAGDVYNVRDTGMNYAAIEAKPAYSFYFSKTENGSSDQYYLANGDTSDIYLSELFSSIKEVTCHLYNEYAYLVYKENEDYYFITVKDNLYFGSYNLSTYATSHEKSLDELIEDFNLHGTLSDGTEVFKSNSKSNVTFYWDALGATVSSSATLTWK